MKLSAIFDPEPECWGFRGDPYFWRHLRHRVSRVDLPVDPDKLEKFIRKEHYELSGTRLTDSSIAVVGEFRHGGMTSGGLSGHCCVILISLEYDDSDLRVIGGAHQTRSSRH